MVRYTRKKKRIRRKTSLRSTEAKKRLDANSQSVLKRRPSGKGELGVFLRKHIKVVAIAALLVVIGVIVVAIIVSGKKTAPSVAQEPQSIENQEVLAEPTDMHEDEFAEYTEEAGYNYDGVEDSVLAGLTGSDDSLFSDDEDMEEAIFEAEGIRIGVTIGSLDSDTEKLYLGKMEQTSNEYEVDKLVYEVYYYNALGDFNQQLQDVRSLIKNEVDVIIIANSTKEGFKMVTAMAGEAGIPVVAYNAPDGTTGYEINIAADDTSWGKIYGQFMAENLSSGSVLQVLGSEKSDVDILRAAAINEALITNEQLKLEDVIYANWDEDDAHDAVAEFLNENGIANGVITEEGMALGVLEAYIELQKLPNVMCGDVSAGFIKTWYALKTKGLELEVEPENDDEDAQIVVFKSELGEMTVIAQPAPVSIGAVAFEVAYKLAQGRTVKNPGQTFIYSVDTVITNENLPTYYTMVKDEQDDYLLRDVISQEMLESLLNPEEES